MDTNLPPCANKPNCVSTSDTRKDFAIEPLAYSLSLEEAKAKVKKAADQIGRNRLVKETPDSLTYEFKSAIFRFVDDVEFRFDDKAKKVYFRSESRVGYSDWGVNRKRMEQIRSYFSQL
jgi:uncharacterized protein (DUF1499 family)